jgi:hypothetical protein
MTDADAVARRRVTHARARADRSQQPTMHCAAENALRISFPRFAQKSGFGERR